MRTNRKGDLKRKGFAAITNFSSTRIQLSVSFLSYRPIRLGIGLLHSSTKQSNIFFEKSKLKKIIFYKILPIY